MPKESFWEMTDKKRTDSFLFHKPCAYCITVSGMLSASVSDRLGDLRITTEASRKYGTITTIEGEMRDQAELSGLLLMLYEKHLTLLSVQYLSQ
jgi:translation initiation factor 1 (eIF-1/SUI1)